MVNNFYSTPQDCSHYWRQKLELQWVKEALRPLIRNVPNILIDGVNLEALLNEGSSYLKYYSELLKEYIFEEERAINFPDRPTRKKCMFLFDIGISPDEYAKKINFPLGKYRLLEIETLDEGSKLFRAKTSLLNCNLMQYSGMKLKAQEYWKGTDEINLDTEILFEGNYKIVKIHS